MIYALKRARLRAALFVFLVGTLVPSKSFADMPDAGAILDYGFKGFTLGLELGLAVGYLSTGDHYSEREWRKLVLGMGIGALAGMTAGVFIAAADYSSHGAPLGYYILRDTNYATLVGAAFGAVVGTLLWINDGTSRDLMRGISYGVLFGAVVGIVYGIIEGKNASPRDHRRRRYDRDYDRDEWRYSFMPVPVGTSLGVAASVSKTF
ncbi:MAG: hypothetical protein ABW321_35675 [Polyangiales bacterium]